MISRSRTWPRSLSGVVLARGDTPRPTLDVLVTTLAVASSDPHPCNRHNSLRRASPVGDPAFVSLCGRSITSVDVGVVGVPVARPSIKE